MSKKAKNHNEPWNARAVNYLRNLAADNVSSREAAKLLGRAPGAVRYKAMVEKIRFRSINQPKGAQIKAQRTIKAAARKRSAAAKKAAATRSAKVRAITAQPAP